MLAAESTAWRGSRQSETLPSAIELAVAVEYPLVSHELTDQVDDHLHLHWLCLDGCDLFTCLWKSGLLREGLRKRHGDLLDS